MADYRNLTIKVTRELVARADRLAKEFKKLDPKLVAVMGSVSRSAVFRIAAAWGLEALEGLWVRIPDDLLPHLQRVAEAFGSHYIDARTHDVGVMALRSGVELMRQKWLGEQPPGSPFPSELETTLKDVAIRAATDDIWRKQIKAALEVSTPTTEQEIEGIFLLLKQAAETGHSIPPPPRKKANPTLRATSRRKKK